jgi:[ribosomal protein S18]-alanine N-acetyltransferase
VIRFRSLERGDERALKELFSRNSRPETARYFHPFPLTAAQATELATHQGRDRYYIAERAATIIGLSMLRGWDDGYEIPSFGILVDQEWRKLGVGADLTDFTLGEALRLGAPAVRLSVYASHGQAVRLYIHKGFTETSRTRVETVDGEDHVIVMHKTLDA